MSKTSRKRTPAKRSTQVTWAQAVRDIVITAMNRGQLPILGILGIIFLLVWKLPEEAASVLLFDLIEKLDQGELWAYMLLVIVVIAWFVHARLMRKEFSEEYRRIGLEKSKLQSKASGINYRSSDKS